MAIDPRVLKFQRAVVGGLLAPAERPPRNSVLCLVKPLGRKPKCECGECPTCRKREGMRLYRARRRLEVEPLKSGPRFALGRQCLLCRGPISDQNGTGFCKPCQKHRPSACHELRVAASQWSDGGGI